MKLATFCATACLLLLSAGDAAANITYVANRAVGDGTLDLSITTDGTLGLLTSANILDWSLDLDDGVTAITLEGPSGLNNSIARVFGDRLTATASDLLFDFDFVFEFDPASFTIQIFPGVAGIGAVDPYWCVAASFACFDQQEESFSSDGTSVELSHHTGLFVVGSVNTAVPEPAAWALAITGFAAAGIALRRHARTAQA